MTDYLDPLIKRALWIGGGVTLALSLFACAPEQMGASGKSSNTPKRGDESDYLELDEFQSMPRTAWLTDESKNTYTTSKELVFKGSCSRDLYGAQVFRDGSTTPEATLTCESRKFTWSTTVTADGSYSFEFAPITSDLKSAGTPVKRTVVVDTTPPKAPLIITNEGNDLVSDTARIVIEGTVDPDVIYVAGSGGNGVLTLDTTLDKFTYVLTLKDGDSVTLNFVALDFVRLSSDPTTMKVSYLAKRILASSAFSGSAQKAIPTQTGARAVMKHTTMTSILGAPRAPFTGQARKLHTGILSR